MTEEIYDEEIAPLLKKAGDLCVKYGIPFLAVTEYSPGEVGETRFQTNDECLKMVMIRHCVKTAPNIDGFLIGLIRWAKDKGIDMDQSIFLRQYMIDNQPPVQTSCTA